RVLNPDESVRSLHDHFAARDLGRIGKRRLELLLAHPGGCDAGRLGAPSPPVTLGGLGSAVSSFSSRTQVAATRFDSSASTDVSKKSMELMTPLSASMRW